MLSFGKVLAFIAAFVALLVTTAPAIAKASSMRYRAVAVDANSQIVQSGRYNDADAIVSAFQGVFKNATKTDLTLKYLLEANRSKLIPACYPYQGKNVSHYKSAGDDTVWNDCPAENQRLVVIPRTVVRIPLKVAADNAKTATRINNLKKKNTELKNENKQLKEEAKSLTSSLEQVRGATQKLKQEGLKLQTQVDSLVQKNEQLVAEASKPANRDWPAVIIFVIAAFVVGLILGKFRKRPQTSTKERPAITGDTRALQRAEAEYADLSTKYGQLETANQQLLDRAEKAEKEKEKADVAAANALAQAQTASDKSEPPPMTKPSGNGEEKKKFVPKAPPPSRKTPVEAPIPKPSAQQNASTAEVEDLGKYRDLREKIAELDGKLSEANAKAEALELAVKQKPAQADVPADLAEMQRRLDKAEERARRMFDEWKNIREQKADLARRLGELEVPKQAAV